MNKNRATGSRRDIRILKRMRKYCLQVFFPSHKLRRGLPGWTFTRWTDSRTATVPNKTLDFGNVSCILYCIDPSEGDPPRGPLQQICA